MEDTWVPTQFYFEQQNPVSSLAPIPYTGTDKITVVISVQWGWIDIFGTVWQCHAFACRNVSFADEECSGTFVVNGDPFGHITNPPSCNATCGELCKLNSIVYSYQVKTLTSPPKRILTIVGQYAAVLSAFQNLTYRPDPYQNSRRLASRYYSPTQAELGPYEKLVTEVHMLGKLVASITQMVEIDDVDNAPTLTNPTVGYQPPPICAVDPLTTYEPCHFGQFFRSEDTDTTLSVPGIQAADVDLFESCTWAVPQCSTVRREL